MPSTPTARPTFLHRIARIRSRFGEGRTRRDARRREVTERENGDFEGTGTARKRDFERDYRRAVDLLKERMDQAHPAACHSKLRDLDAASYVYGQARMTIVDDASTAIAMALREGASVAQAAEAGAASIDL